MTASTAGRGLAAILAVAGTGLLAAGCGASPGANSPALSGTSAQENGARAFSGCMRTHGVSRFPDPDSRGNLPPLTQQMLGVSKQATLAAQRACEHLLSRGGGTATPQQRQEKLAFGLRVARCLRTHGFPDMPDPGASRQTLPPGIDPSSPEFQAAETACERQAQRALGLR